MKTHLIILILLSSLFSQLSLAKNSLNKISCTCVDTLQDEINEENSKQDNEYSKLYDSYLNKDDESQILQGTAKDQAIILIHGFIASPFEVKEIATRLNEIGYTVYMPLLYGFGAHGDTPNHGKLKIWRNQIKESVKKLSRCFSKISIGGISLGGALATDYILNSHDPKIHSLVLLSPYFDISQSIARLLVGPISAMKSGVDIDTLYTLSHSDDLIEILKHKSHYSDIMPLVTLQELFLLSDELKIHHEQNKLNVPTFIAYSEFDTTINLNLIDSVVKNNFQNSTSFIITKDLKVPHQITYEESNPKFENMMRKLSMFIDQSIF